MSKVKVIALVGMPGSGKGTCTDYMSENYGWPVIHFGNMVYDEVQKRGLDNVKDEKFVREDMRAKEGPAVMAKRVAVKAKEYLADGADVVVLDGLYSWSEFKHLHGVFSDSLLMLAVASPRHVRHERVVNRKDSHRQYTTEQIRERDIEEIENLEKGGPIAYANYTILNDSSLDDMLKKLNEILGKENLI